MKFFKRSKRKDENGEYKERIITSLNDIISGLRISLGWDKEKPLTIDGVNAVSNLETYIRVKRMGVRIEAIQCVVLMYRCRQLCQLKTVRCTISTIRLGWIRKGGIQGGKETVY